ncbi:NfeD family protein [Butyrivibrio sp. AE2032]|jgi:membrane protein implicated in regulation of membrane protease activity|uniref:NfeD family protein n=1 Tax=Butyrivibrio sp. AE2032 TaxID=1458463 RepID=UPI00055403A3|nr:NfeD family protein [Butyrivibrio sp. AE2032]
MDISISIIWLVVTVILSVIEIFTMGLVTIWFAAGAAVAFLLSLFDAPIVVQVVAFLVVSIVVLVLVRPIAAKHFNNRLKKTNIDAYIGRKLIAKTEIDNLHGTGKVDMDGSTWLAVSSMDNVVIPAGSEVKVVEVRGAKLIVEREDI